MSRQITSKTTFASGEVSPEVLGRPDLRSYANGAKRLRNVFIRPTGGVARRPGLRHVAPAASGGRLIAFSFNTEQTYLLVFTDQTMEVYMDDALQASVAVPWTEAQLPKICWTQSADTLLVVHPDVAPKKITRTSHVDWTVEDWAFFKDTENDLVHLPYHKFAKDDVTLQPSATTGSVTLTASADLFVADHVGTRFKIQGKQVAVTAVTSATVATATVKETLPNTTATKDFEEQAFSAVHGWPATVIFHQDRLVIGGGRDVPNRLWLSKSSDLFNFDLGTGLDDEAIEFAILSDQVNAITGVFSGRHLQVLTSGAEWMVTGDPLTPQAIQVKRQTRIGSPVDRYVPPRDIEGATLFVSANGQELREFIYADVEQAYRANDLALASRHLINAPVDMDYDSKDRLLFLVMGDGSMATITNYRAEEVTAWTVQHTDGQFKAVTVLDSVVYLLVSRNGTHVVERLDEALHTDAGLAATAEVASTDWSGLDHLDGKTVKVVGDGALMPERTVSGGQVTLDYAVTEVEIGLPFTHEIEPLPPALKGGRGPAHGLPVRLIRATFRLLETAALYVDVGRGANPVPFKTLPDGVLDAAAPVFTGDVSVRGLGWKRSDLAPLWRIEQDVPLPCTILSATTEQKVNV